MLDILQFKIVENMDAVSRVVEAFKQYYTHTEVKHPQYILQRVVEDLGIDLSFLSSCEREQIKKEIEEFINEIY